MMNRLLCGAALALLVAVTACDAGADRAAAGETDGRVENGRVGDGDQMRSAPAQLMPIDHSGVTGTAVADRDGDRLVVTLSLEGLQAGARYLAHVHEGRCADDGPARVPLGRITGDDDGMSTVELRAEAGDMSAGAAWSVQVEAETGEAVACANLMPQ
jgi:hypothetical protein